MTTPEKIEALKDKIGSVSIEHQAAYCHGKALRSLYDERKEAVSELLRHHPAPMPMKISNTISATYGVMNVQVASDFATLTVLLNHWEASPEFIEATGIIQPLIDKLAELETQHAAEVAERGRLQNAITAATEAARLKAEELAASDPSVIAAKAALDAMESPPKSKAK